MSNLRHLKAKSILLKISIFESLSSKVPSPDIKKFETCQYWLLWQYRFKKIDLISGILPPKPPAAMREYDPP